MSKRISGDILDNITKCKLPEDLVQQIYTTPVIFGHGLFSEVVFYKNYSREKADGTHENFHDVVVRVLEGVLTILSSHKRRLPEKMVDKHIRRMAHCMLNMYWLPAGRGLWAMGTDFVYKYGAAALNNCAAVSTKDLEYSVGWTMDMLMQGAGVGFNTDWSGELYEPNKKVAGTYVIEDSREGWIESTRRLIRAYTTLKGTRTPFPKFDYSSIRKCGTKIRGFGGVAGGAEPLKLFHERLKIYFDTAILHKSNSHDAFMYLYKHIVDLEYGGDPKVLDRFCATTAPKQYDTTRLLFDIFNAEADCVISGNVRRSSENGQGRPGDRTFLYLKDMEVNPEREHIAYSSNNSLVFTDENEVVVYLDDAIRLSMKNGEPGFLFMFNMGNPYKDHLKAHLQALHKDYATMSNPCGEMCLEPYEMCNLAEIFLDIVNLKTRGSAAKNAKTYKHIAKCATLYCKAVSLIPTRYPRTNHIMTKNRRFGVGISGFASMYDTNGLFEIEGICSSMYSTIRRFDRKISSKLGVPESVRITTIKPSGTLSLLAGSTPGVMFPVGKYIKRRIRISTLHNISRILIDAGVEYEKSVTHNDTLCFAFYISYNLGVRTQSQVSFLEKLSLVTSAQRVWADNMVSNTLTFDPETEDMKHITNCIAMNIPFIKSCTLLPMTKGVYQQMPYEEITYEEFQAGFSRVKKIDWSKLGSYEEAPPMYCESDVCLFGT
jgi:ribonucleoside-diphosphate reductase alpha chain